MVGIPGVEPGTSRLSVVRSNQLSYTPGNTYLRKLGYYINIQDKSIFFYVLLH